MFSVINNIRRNDINEVMKLVSLNDLDEEEQEDVFCTEAWPSDEDLDELDEIRAQERWNRLHH